MSRKAQPQEQENHERWMVSYADFITLMFAFFVVMFAASQADKARAKQVSESVTRALDGGKFSATVARITGDVTKNAGAAKAGPIADLQASLDYLTTELKREILAGKLQVRLDPRGLVVSLTEAAFFRSAEDTIEPAAYPTIEKIALVIRRLPNPVRLEGHTDSVPIHNSRFRNNWELSSARSIAMLELLTSHCGVPETRLAVAGYADTSPVDSNGTAEGRAHNRRVDIIILNKLGIQAEPAQKPTGSH